MKKAVEQRPYNPQKFAKKHAAVFLALNCGALRELIRQSKSSTENFCHLFLEVKKDAKEKRHQEFKRIQSLKAHILECTVDGEMWVEEWGRDCDMCEATSYYKIEASYEALIERQQDMWDNAEGSCSLLVITPDEAAEAKNEFRDRALEAFEDGHPHVIY